MGLRFTNLDSAESAFLENQVEHIKAQTYDVKYPNLKARELFPLSDEGGPGVNVITYYQYDQFGLAKIVQNASNDIPRVDLTGKEFSSKVRSIAAAFGYSKQDIRSAKFAGIPLEQRKANAAKRAIMTLENQIAFDGDAANNIQGLLTNPNVSVFTVPVGTGGTTFATKTADEILADLNGITNEIVENTKGVEQPDTLIMPYKQFNIISSKRIGTDASETILSFFKKTNAYIKNVIPVNELEGKGTGGTDIMVAYRRSPDVLELQVPMDFEQGEIEVRGLEFIVSCEERFGGVVVYYPLAICKGEGI